MLSVLANLFRKYPSVRLNVLIYQEDNEWIAHCLQMDIMAASKDRATVQDDIIDLIKAQVEFALENNNMEGIFKSAPAEEWEKLLHFQRCGVRKITIHPPKKDNGVQSIPIKEVELCFA